MAVSISIPFQPKAPSPLRTTTGRSGAATLAPIPNGIPTPMHPCGPALRLPRALIDRNRLAREIENLVAVDDEDGVARDDVLDFVAQAQRMNRDLVGMQQRRVALEVRAMLGGELRDPGALFAGLKRPLACVGELLEDESGVADDPDLGGAIVADLACRRD